MPNLMNAVPAQIRTSTANGFDPNGQIVMLMYLHTKLVPEGSGKRKAASDLVNLKKQLSETADLAPSNDIIRSCAAFLTKVIDSWFR